LPSSIALSVPLSVTIWQNEAKPITHSQLPIGIIRRAFGSAGVEFIDEKGGGAELRLRKRQQKKA
jgi:hypothetical protein